MKPTHRPPNVKQLYDRELVLLSLNLCIEAYKADYLPEEFLTWLYANIIKQDSSSSESVKTAA